MLKYDSLFELDDTYETIIVRYEGYGNTFHGSTNKHLSLIIIPIKYDDDSDEKVRIAKDLYGDSFYGKYDNKDEKIVYIVNKNFYSDKLCYKTRPDDSEDKKVKLTVGVLNLLIKLRRCKIIGVELFYWNLCVLVREKEINFYLFDELDMIRYETEKEDEREMIRKNIISAASLIIYFYSRDPEVLYGRLIELNCEKISNEKIKKLVYKMINEDVVDIELLCRELEINL